MAKIVKSISFFVLFQIIFIVLFGVFGEFDEKVGLDSKYIPS